MSKPKSITDTFKQIEHAAYLEALRNGQHPHRAATFTDRKKRNSRLACRRFRYDD